MRGAAQYFLIADIGGTRSRLAVVDDEATILHREFLDNQDYAGLEGLLMRYLDSLPDDSRPGAGILAVACPVAGDQVKLTNLKWEFSTEKLRAMFKFDFLHVINDFIAVALAVPTLQQEDYLEIGRGTPVPGKPIGVIGPGTGLGVSFLVPHEGVWLPQSSEGGHVSIAAGDDFEAKIIEIVRRQYGHVSAERLLSGRGLPVLYEAIAELEGKTVDGLTAEQITGRDEKKSDPVATRSIDTFMALLGTVAGDLAVTIDAKGGIYMAGGILPRIRHRLVNSRFRDRFTDKGRFRDYLDRIPTHLIISDQVSLDGLRNYLGRLIQSGSESK